MFRGYTRGGDIPEGVGIPEGYTRRQGMGVSRGYTRGGDIPEGVGIPEGIPEGKGWVCPGGITEGGQYTRGGRYTPTCNLGYPLPHY